MNKKSSPGESERDILTLFYFLRQAMLTGLKIRNIYKFHGYRIGKKQTLSKLGLFWHAIQYNSL